MAKVELKQPIVQAIVDDIQGAQSIVLVDYRGLTVAQDTELRKQLREAGIIYKVCKNTMMKRAFEGTEFAALDEHLEGPSAIAISKDDATAPARIICKFAKDAKALELKAGVVEGVAYDAEALGEIAKIPSREELLSKLSEEDREALRLGRELQKKKAGAEPDVEIAGEIGITAEDVKKAAGQKAAPVRKGKIVWKRVAVLAAAVIAVFAIGITSVGGPERFIEKMKQTVGGREMTQVDSDNDYVVNSGERKEETAYQRVKDEYGFDPVKIVGRPDEMVFDRVEMDSDIPLAQFVYDLDGQIITYIVDALYLDNSWGLDVEDVLLEKYEYPLEKATAMVEAYRIADSGNTSYVAQFDYRDVHYTLTGLTEKEDLELILKNLHFL